MTEHTPANGLCVEKVAVKLGNIPQLPCLQPVCGGVVCIKEDLTQWFLAKTIFHQPEELLISFLLTSQ